MIFLEEIGILNCPFNSDLSSILIIIVLKSLFLKITSSLYLSVRGIDLSFPWNVPLDTIDMLLSLTLAASGFLIGTASFVLGLYLSERHKMAPREELMPFVYLISSLISLPIVIVAVGCVVIMCSSHPSWMKLNLLLILLAPIVPAVAIICILVRKRPLRRSSAV